MSYLRFVHSQLKFIQLRKPSVVRGSGPAIRGRALTG